MAQSRETPDALAGRVWTIMFDYLMRSAPHRTRSLARRKLTPSDSRALFTLSRDQGRTMRSLAEAWACDPSNATWIVDRLEKLGLAERRSMPGDRRVKLVVLTARGQRTRIQLLKEFHEPPPELLRLTRNELETLQRILARLAEAPPPSPPKARGSPDFEGPPNFFRKSG